MPPIDVEKVKEANPIELVIAETEPLTDSGRYRHGKRHDSLVVDTQGQAYFWNSMGADDQGDVITWVIKHCGCADFKDAVEWLSRRAGLPSPEWKGADAKERLAARARDDVLTVAARWMVRRLRATPAAFDYARGRGWTEETIQAAGLGYSGGPEDRKDLVGEFQTHGMDMTSNAVRAVLKLPPGMLVYPHVRHGRVRYLSARSIEGKRHYNLEAELVGDRQLYVNWHWAPTVDFAVIVEGQADAVSLGQWGIPAIAIAGVSADDELQRATDGHQRVYIGLDADQAGAGSAMRLASLLGPLTRLVEWPAKDANDWLKAEPTPVDVEQALEKALTYVERVCQEAGDAPAGKRMEAIKEAFKVVARLGDAEQMLYRKALCKLLRIDQREFNNLLKIARRELGKEEDQEELAAPEEIVGGYIADHLLELVYDPAANETKLAVRFPGGELAEMHMISLPDGLRYQAVWPSQMMTQGVVLFPSALGPDLPPLELRQRIQRHIHRWLDVPPMYERLASYYVMFTWVYDCFRTVPYLRALGGSGTGKSRYLDTIGNICYRPMRTMGATTTSPVFRLLDRYKGTLIIDEADWSQSDTTADMIKIINVGFSRGTPLLRSGSDQNNFEPEAFSVYGPKILSTRKKFQDDATEKRCLTHQTGGPTTRPDIPLTLTAEFDAEALAIRNCLLTYRLKHWKPEIQVDESLIDRQAVEPRLNQVILGLITMVDDQALRDDINHLVKDYNSELIADRSMTLAARILEALVGIISGPTAGLNISGEPYWDLSLKRLAAAVNRLIDNENEGDEDEAQPAGGQPQPQKFKSRRDVSSRTIGKVCRDEFHLVIARTTYGTQSMGVTWDGERVKELCGRYGVDWKEPGSKPAAAGSQAESASQASLV